jgi:hypothetical protein
MHDLAAAKRATSPTDGAAVWGTFYDIRRYGGLQIFLRVVLGNASSFSKKSRQSSTSTGKCGCRW